MGSAAGVHPRNEQLFLLVNILCTQVGSAAAGEILKEIPAVQEEPRLNVLSRVAIATEVWLMERQRAREILAERQRQAQR